MKFLRLFCVLPLLFSAGCATHGPRIIAPRPLITYDAQGRVLRHVTFNPDHSVDTVKAWQYIDSGISVETVTAYETTNGWIETETYHMLDSAVGLKKVRTFDADGNLVSDGNSLLNPGRRAVKLNKSP